MRKAKYLLGLFVLAGLFMSGLPKDAWAGKADGRGNAPKYYTYDDLRQVAEDYRTYFEYESTQMPSGHMILPRYAANRDPLWMASRKGLRILSSPSSFMKFYWEGYPQIRKGDIISVRGEDKSSAILSWFTSWTHDALAWDRGQHQVLESMPDGGVQIRSTDTSWKGLAAYTINSVKGVDAAAATDQAAHRYVNRPYFPTNIEKGRVDLIGFFSKWADRDNPDSMYCSKLVWKTFKDKGVDLDSNRTKAFILPWSIPSPTFWGFNGFAWIGVSPDDIYGASQLGPDFDAGTTYGIYDVLHPSVFK